MRYFDITLKLPIRSDLCLASYAQAESMLDTPYYVFGGKRQLQQDVIEAIITKHAVGFQMLPDELLQGDELSWYLTGYLKEKRLSVVVLGWWPF